MRRSGFTLIELLVVFAMLGLLFALLLPAVHAARRAARDAECRHNLHEIGVDLHSREGRRGEIPDFMEGPHYFECPEHLAIYGTRTGPYAQICVRDLRHALVEAYQAPSERIVAVYDIYPVHHETRFAVFLDGHVGAICDSDVGYEDL